MSERTLTHSVPVTRKDTSAEARESRGVRDRHVPFPLRYASALTAATLIAGLWLTGIPAWGDPFEGISTPGFFSGQARFPASNQNEDRNNFITEAIFQQGVDVWTPFPGVTVRPYAEIELSFDIERYDFNNFYRFGVGGEVAWQPAQGLKVALGTEYEWEKRFLTDNTLTGPAAYVRWFGYYQHDYGPVLFDGQPLGLVATTWGNFRYPARHDSLQKDTGLLQGNIQLGVDFYRLHPRLQANLFSEFGYKLDTKRLGFNNKIEPGFGGKLKLALRDAIGIEMGLKYTHEYRFVSKTNNGGFITFLNWYASYK